jgi:GntR family transcriptional regulator / MocR family aminotransferase
MSRVVTTPPLPLPDRPAAAPAAEWLGEVLRAAVHDGRLAAGDQLPSARTLATQTGLARGTVDRACEQLVAEGYLERAVGRGTFVRRVRPTELRPVPRPHRQPTHIAPLQRTPWADRVQLLEGYGAPSTKAFAAIGPALDHFPVALWSRIAARRLRRATPRDLLGAGPHGAPALQQEVWEYLQRERGVRCAREQVLIVAGVREALDLVSRVVLHPGDTAMLEDPGYRGARAVFSAHGATLLPAPVDADGIVLPTAQRVRPRIVYVTPAHQFPQGMSMSAARRFQLLAWAQARGTLIFEDDYDSEYRYRGRPMPALQGLDTAEQVCFAGSFSKVLYPGLRLGYLVVPPSLLDAVLATRSISTLHQSMLEQLIVAEFLADGHFHRHVRRMREIYAERHEVLLSAVRSELAGVLAISPIEAGLQTHAWLPSGTDARDIVARAAARGIVLESLDKWALQPLPRAGLQLGFATIEPAEIRAGIARLAPVLRPT